MSGPNVDTMSMKEIMAALKEFGEVVENFESKAEMKGCLRRHFQDGTGAEVEINLGSLYNNFLRKREKLNDIRGVLLENLASPYFGGRDGFKDHEKDVTALDQFFDDSACRILVLGNTSAGKSLFLNVIMGEEVLPSSPLPCTSAICEITKATKNQYRVLQNGKLFAEGDLGDNPKETLRPFLFYEGDDRKKVDFETKIQITWNTPLLDTGVILVDSPGLEENQTINTIVEKYAQLASAIICIVDSTQGSLTQQLREVLKGVSYDMSATGGGMLHRDAVLFVCNKWTIVSDKDKPAALARIMEDARTCWSPEITPDKFVTIDSKVAFDSWKSQRRQTKESIVVKKALVLLLEQAFHYLLLSLWRRLTSICYKMKETVRTERGLMGKDSADRTKLIKETQANLQKVEKSLEVQGKKEIREKYKAMFGAAKGELKQYLESTEFKGLCNKWAEGWPYTDIENRESRISPDEYCDRIESGFRKHLAALILAWEEKKDHLFFKKCIDEIQQALVFFVYNAEQARMDATKSLRGGLGFDVFVYAQQKRSVPVYFVVPFFLLYGLFAKFIKFLDRLQSKKGFIENPKEQPKKDVAKIASSLNADTIASKMFNMSEEMMKRAFEDVDKRTKSEIKDLKKLETDEIPPETRAACEDIFQRICGLEYIFLGFYRENLWTGSLDPKKLTLDVAFPGFTQIRKAHYDGVEVSVEISTASEEEIDKILQFEDILLSYKHKNLLAYRGCYIDKADNSCKIISAPRGTGLKQILKSPNGISFEEKVKIVRDVAEALLFIQEMGLSYGQVTVDDIWVNLNGTALLAGFGIPKSYQGEVLNDRDSFHFGGFCQAGVFKPEEIQSHPDLQKLLIKTLPNAGLYPTNFKHILDVFKTL